MLLTVSMLRAAAFCAIIKWFVKNLWRRALTASYRLFAAHIAVELSNCEPQGALTHTAEMTARKAENENI